MHLGGATGLQANFGRKLRAHKVTSAGLDDYITTVVTNFLADREADESFATWVARADEDLLRGEQDARQASRAVMSERAVPFHCPYCGEQDLWPHESSRAGEAPPHGAWECRGCLRAFIAEDARPGPARRGSSDDRRSRPPRPASFRGTHTEGRSPEELRELVSHVGRRARAGAGRGHHRVGRRHVRRALLHHLLHG